MRIRDERSIPASPEPPLRTFADVPVGTVFMAKLHPTGFKAGPFLKAGIPIDEAQEDFEGLSSVVIRLDEPDNIWFEEGIWSEDDDCIIERHADMVMYEYEVLNVELVVRNEFEFVRMDCKPMNLFQDGAGEIE